MKTMQANGVSEVFFIDGADGFLSNKHKTLIKNSTKFLLDMFDIQSEVDVYVSKRSELQKVDASSHGWHSAPTYSRINTIITLYVDPRTTMRNILRTLSHEMVHAWQTERGCLDGVSWKGEDLGELPYELQPWEIEAHGCMEEVCEAVVKSLPINEQRLMEIQEETNQTWERLKAEIIRRIREEGNGVGLPNSDFGKMLKGAALLGVGVLLGI